MDITGVDRDYQVWVPFKDDAEVLLRYIPTQELDNIRKKATSLRWDKKHQRETEHDRIENNRLLGRAVVLDWKGLVKDGSPFPYSPENCDLLMTKFIDFGVFVNSVSTDLQALQAEEQRQLSKKS